MAWREIRASWVRLVFFFLCVALGVAAIVVLRSIMQNVRITLTREARDLVGGDVVLLGGHAWTDAERAQIKDTLAPAPFIATEVVETQTMATRVVGGELTNARLV